MHNEEREDTMYIPLYTREEFNTKMREVYHIFHVIPTDEAYASYRQFVLDRAAPIGTGPVVVGEDDNHWITVETKQAA